MVENLPEVVGRLARSTASLEDKDAWIFIAEKLRAYGVSKRYIEPERRRVRQRRAQLKI
jgi:acetylornithine deacetylase/succinyl-diaminopimelate desuccinylase-like protein